MSKRNGLEMYDKLRKEGINPSVPVVLSALKVCSASMDLVTGKRIHSELVHNRHLGKNSYVANTLVAMYSNCGCMEDAKKIFDGMCHRTVVSWNALIRGYAENGEPEMALKLFTCMKETGCVPNRVTYLATLKACAYLAEREEPKLVDGKLLRVNSLEKGRGIHSEISETEVELHSHVASTLVDMYGKCGSMQEAQSVFDRMESHDVVAWSSIILGYAEAGRGDTALVLFARMQQEGGVPNAVTFLAALKACVSLASREEPTIVGRRVIRIECLRAGKMLHSQVLKTGLESDNFLANSLLDMYGKCGSMTDAQSCFDRMWRRDTVSWNAVIQGHAESEDGNRALEFYARMKQEGCVPTCITYLAALKACVSLNCLEKGREIHSELMKSGLENHLSVCSMLVDMYCKCGSVSDAREVFDTMQHRDVYTWTAMISGYEQSGECYKALELFSRMQDQTSCCPNSVTFLAALSACGGLGDMQAGKAVHAGICNAGVESELPVSSALIEFYGKSGSMVEAETVFISMQTLDLVMWNALIAAFGRQGNTTRVLDLFESMRKERWKPSEVTFVSVLSSCSHAGVVDRGRRYFRMMWEEYEMVPSAEHYSCMVDLLGRANRLDEAVEMVRAMAVKPSVMVWMTVLSGCRKWNNVEVGKVAFESILELDKDGNSYSAAYVLMANVYSGAGLWKESASLCRKD